MKTFIKKTTLILVTTLLFINCSIDEVETLDQLSENNLITDVQSARNFLSGLYSLQRDGTSSFSILASATLGLELKANRDVPIFSGATISSNTITPDTDGIDRYYKFYYRIINQSNWLINKLETLDSIRGLSDTERKEMIAVAKFFRADSHFQLLRKFGQFYDLNSSYGIVLKTAPSRGNSSQARNTVREVYDQIIEDLIYSSNNGATNTAHYYISAVTAKALLSKVYLYSKDYSNASILALETINSSEYALENNFTDIFDNQYNSSEVLFAPFSSGNEAPTNFITAVLFVFARPANNFKATFNTDPRFNDTFLYLYGFYFRSFKKYPLSFSAPSTLYLYRLAEYYLVYAEAEARKTGGDLNAALAKLNDIRNRVGITPKVLTTKDQLLDDIRNEKLIELASETGESTFDLIRYHALGDIDGLSLKATLTTTDKFIFPIPRTVRDGNTLLTQNPGY